MFPSGCEFLVCNVVEDVISGVTNIYLREICLGFAKNVILWIADDLTDDKLVLHSKALRKQEHNDNTGFEGQYIMKTSSNIARAYLHSPLFKLSLHMSDSIKLIQNLQRLNENDINVDCQALILEKNASVKFMLDFKGKVDKLPVEQQRKITTAIYKSNEEENIQEVIDEFITDDTIGSDAAQFFQSVKSLKSSQEALQYSRLAKTDKNFSPAQGLIPEKVNDAFLVENDGDDVIVVENNDGEKADDKAE